ncbi:hypothetical protein [Gilvimarinus chinensis]|uniref:hypothetical protein n=1 Tax=Gilvimarinus chinensis TaxID=396005 RepID=UPI00037FBD2E|nr:hypothetical protein [Gilvimarinus chinensis]
MTDREYLMTAIAEVTHPLDIIEDAIDRIADAVISWQAARTADPNVMHEPEFTRAGGEVEAFEVTNDMVMAFHDALTDGPISESDFNEIKIGLNAALVNHTHPTPAAGGEVESASCSDKPQGWTPENEIACSNFISKVIKNGLFGSLNNNQWRHVYSFATTPAAAVLDGWETGCENWPVIGGKYLITIAGIVQHETYEFDRGDDGMGGGGYFWSRDDIDDCPEFNPDDLWLRVDTLTAAPQPVGESESGLIRAAKYIEEKAESYDLEHGTTEGDTGARVYPGNGEDHYNSLMELAEELRELDAQPPEGER